MYGAITDEVNKLYNEDKEINNEALEDIFNDLYYTKTSLENLDTNMDHDILRPAYLYKVPRHK